MKDIRIKDIIGTSIVYLLKITNQLFIYKDVWYFEVNNCEELYNEVSIYSFFFNSVFWNVSNATSEQKVRSWKVNFVCDLYNIWHNTLLQRIIIKNFWKSAIAMRVK